jgi:hypothetical protein
VGLVHGIFGMNSYTTGAPQAPMSGYPGPGYPGVAGPGRDWRQRNLLRYMTIIDPATIKRRMSPGRYGR